MLYALVVGLAVVADQLAIVGGVVAGLQFALDRLAINNGVESSGSALVLAILDSSWLVSSGESRSMPLALALGSPASAKISAGIAILLCW